jgi:hypothetical protein
MNSGFYIFYSGLGGALSYLALGAVLASGLFLMMFIIVIALVIYKKW